MSSLSPKMSLLLILSVAVPVVGQEAASTKSQHVATQTRVTAKRDMPRTRRSIPTHRNTKSLISRPRSLLRPKRLRKPWVVLPRMDLIISCDGIMTSAFGTGPISSRHGGTTIATRIRFPIGSTPLPFGTNTVDCPSGVMVAPIRRLIHEVRLLRYGIATADFLLGSRWADR